MFQTTQPVKPIQLDRCLSRCGNFVDPGREYCPACAASNAWAEAAGIESQIRKLIAGEGAYADVDPLERRNILGRIREAVLVGQPTEIEREQIEDRAGAERQEQFDEAFGQ